MAPGRRVRLRPANIDAPPRPSRVKVLKLHGSANWEQRNEYDCAPTIASPMVFFLGAPTLATTLPKGTGWGEGRRLITPTYLKDLSTHPLLLQLWYEAARAIAGAVSIAVLGYSLQPPDALARYLIASA